VDYRDELRRAAFGQPPLQPFHSLPHCGAVPPIFRNRTRRPGSMSAMGTGLRRCGRSFDV